MIGSGLAGILLALNNVLASSIGVGGIPGFLSIFPNQWGIFFVGMAIVLIIPFGATVLFGKIRGRGGEEPDNNAKADNVKATTPASLPPMIQEKAGSKESAANVLEIVSPVRGQIVPLEEVPDPAFAERQMGKGVAVNPSEGKVYAPFDATVAHVIKSKHAMILEHATGVQILIHIGINTVSMKGSGFTAHAATGDQVKAGQLLLEFDRDAITAAGYPLTSPVIVPDGQDIIERVEELIPSSNPVHGQAVPVLKIYLKG